MTRPHKHPKTGVFYFRQKTPADLRDKFGKAEISWSLRTKNEDEAKLRNALAVQQQARIWQSLRTGPGPIPHKRLLAIAGDFYRTLTEMVEDEPGEPSLWVTMLEKFSDTPLNSDALARWFGPEADRLLLEEGLSADAYSRNRLCEELHKVWLQWSAFQLQRAQGDYSPDVKANRFPEWKPPIPPENALSCTTSESVTITELFDLWKTLHLNANKAPRSVVDFEQKIASLKSFLGHDDAQRVTGRKVDEWCDQLLASGLAPKTVGEKYLAAVKVVFKLGVEKFRLDVNPVAANRVRVPQKVRERSLGFTEIEARAILRATQVDPSALGKRNEGLKSAIRWVPWICAYSGARVTEITQLRREDFLSEYGIPCLRITPEGGSVKTGNYRIVPIHRHLEELGLLKFISDQPPGPLFYKPSKNGTGLTARAKGVSGKVGEWVREVAGITDKRVWPNHGWRHRFTTLCRDAGVSEETRKAIQGHGDGTAAAGYGEFTIKAMKHVMDAFPQIDLKIDA